MSDAKSYRMAMLKEKRVRSFSLVYDNEMKLCI